MIQINQTRLLLQEFPPSKAVLLRVLLASYRVGVDLRATDTSALSCPAYACWPGTGAAALVA